MRLLAFCDYYDPASIGGAERVARELYTRLSRDHEVEITVVGVVPRAAVDPTTGGSVGSSRRTGEVGGIRIASVPGLELSRLLGAQLTFSPKLSRLAALELDRLRPDVVHVNGLHFQSSAVGIRLARRHSLPVVTTAHLADVSDMPGRARRAAQVFDRVAGGRVLRASSHVLAVSRAVADHVVALGADPSAVSVAHNGVDRERFHTDARGPSTPQLRAVLVGRLIANKGPLIALEAVAMARSSGHDVRLTVIGDGPLEAAVRRRAAEADLAGSVEVVGRVTDVSGWLARADVALRPSFTEGLPLAVLEALASGVPVVCTDVAGNLEAVTDGREGLVVPVADAAKLAGALVRLDDDRAMLSRMSKAAVERSGTFTWEASAEAHLRAFRMASSQRGARP